MDFLLRLFFSGTSPVLGSAAFSLAGYIFALVYLSIHASWLSDRWTFPAKLPQQNWPILDWGILQSWLWSRCVWCFPLSLLSGTSLQLKLRADSVHPYYVPLSSWAWQLQVVDLNPCSRHDELVSFGAEHLISLVCVSDFLEVTVANTRLGTND